MQEQPFLTQMVPFRATFKHLSIKTKDSFFFFLNKIDSLYVL